MLKYAEMEGISVTMAVMITIMPMVTDVTNGAPLKQDTNALEDQVQHKMYALKFVETEGTCYWLLMNVMMAIVSVEMVARLPAQSRQDLPALKEILTQPVYVHRVVDQFTQEISCAMMETVHQVSVVISAAKEKSVSLALVVVPLQ